MKLLMKSYLLMALLALLINFTTNASIAHDDKKGMPDGGPQKWEERHQAEEAKILDQLGLSKEQRSQIDSIKQDAKNQAQTFHHNMFEKRHDFERYLMSPDADEQTADAKVDEFAANMAEMGKLRVNTLFRIRAVMTTAQFQKFVQLREQQHSEWKQQTHCKMNKH